MDPNACIEQILLALKDVQYGNETEQDISVYTVCELFEALDGWLSSGGFLPDRWKTAAKEDHWQHVLSSTNAREYKRGYEDGRHEAIEGDM
jgi:hypothetical protein